MGKFTEQVALHFPGEYHTACGQAHFDRDEATYSGVPPSDDLYIFCAEDAHVKPAA